MTDTSNKKMSLGFEDKISETNFPACKRKFGDAAGLFGEAGKAIVLGMRPDFSPELPRLHFQYTYLDDNGDRQTIIKPCQAAIIAVR